MRNIDYLLPGEDATAFIFRLFKLSPFGKIEDVYEYLNLKRLKLVPGDFQSPTEQALLRHFAQDIDELQANHGHWKRFDYCLTSHQSIERVTKAEIGKFKRLTCNGSNGFLNKPWRWCNRCAIEDEEHFGISYFKRDHQVQGVFSCHKHNTELLDGCDNCGWQPTTLRIFNHPLRHCPSCAASFVDRPACVPEKLKQVQDFSLAMAYGALTLSSREIIELFKQYIGIDEIEEGDGDYFVLVREFHRRLAAYFSIEELQQCFSGINVTRAENRVRALRSNKFFSEAAQSALPLAPVALSYGLAFLDSQMPDQSIAKAA
ncbi:TniQ family protein [Flavobacterium sp. W21_SRS_FM6]|uniref:TniQ family protein n=1 Tax=Flavobacterium sp. W21_SRS_FM6 TaxID=3240268 RepID=UPI003F8EB70A